MDCWLVIGQASDGDLNHDVVTELERLEHARCVAISQGDWHGLAELLLDDYSHTHSTGVVQDKATYLEHVKGCSDDEPPGPRRTRLRCSSAGTQWVAIDSR
jgi:hypothetical protein